MQSRNSSDSQRGSVGPKGTELEDAKRLGMHRLSKERSGGSEDDSSGSTPPREQGGKSPPSRGLLTRPLFRKHSIDAPPSSPNMRGYSFEG